MPTTPVRSFRLDEHADGLIVAAAEREHVSLTESVRRAVLTRDEMQRLTAGDARLFLCRNPKLDPPPGFSELVFVGGL